LRRLATALHIDANFAQFTGYDARSRNSIQAIGMPETILQFNLSVKSRCRFAAEAASVAETINH
jgi:hypothetical protein